MVNRWPVRFGLLLIACATSESADARGVTIHHAEPITLSGATIGAPGAPTKAGHERVAFSALGKRFDLDLESNESLLAPLPATQRREVTARVQIYRGALTGRAGSWVRLSREGADLHGLIWDGREFYSIAPGHAVGGFIDAADAPVTSGNLIYRAADTDIDLGPGFCKALRRPVNASVVNGQAAFEALVGELRSNAALATGVRREIEVALFGDYEFSQNQGTDKSALVERFNMVDGIFSSQLGLRITIGRMEVFTTPDDPFTGADPGQLLDRLGAYRDGHSVLQAFGLTHLVTGRDLDGDIVGMGFIGGVCDSYAGSSLSSDMKLDVTTSAVVAAHELGHNFGAEHDNEPGSACASTPGGYLMNPYVSGSDQFSQCSLDTMEPVIDAAPCVFPAKFADVRVVAPGDTVQGVAGTPFEFSIDVESIGTDAASEVTVDVGFGGWVTIADVSAEAGTCSLNGSLDAVNCNLGTLAVAESRRVTLHATGRFSGKSYAYSNVHAREDDTPANNRLQTSIVMNPRADVTVSSEETRQAAYAGKTITTIFNVDTAGIEPATDVQFTTYMYFVTVLSVQAEGGDCVVEGPKVFCSFGALEPNTRRQVRISYTGAQQVETTLSANVFASNDDNPDNNQTAMGLVITASRDLTTRASAGPIEAVVGEPAHLSFVVSSIGPQAVPGSSFRVTADTNLAITSLASGSAACGLDQQHNYWVCDLGIVASGEQRKIEATVVASTAGTMTVSGSAISDADENVGNEYVYAYVAARFASDVTAILHPSSALDDRPFDLRAEIHALGASPSTGSGVTVTVPVGFSVHSATANQGTCTVDGVTITCSLGTIEPERTVLVTASVSTEAVGQFAITADVHADADQNSSNDHAFTWASVSAATDASVELPAAIAGDVGETLEATFGVRASTHDLTYVRLELSLAGPMTVESATMSGGTCELSGSFQVYCTIDVLAADTHSQVTAHLRSSEAGTGSISAQVYYGSDVDFTNNSGTVDYTVKAESPPDSGNNGGSASGGGGGGGRIDAQWLLLGLALWTIRRRGSLAARRADR